MKTVTPGLNRLSPYFSGLNGEGQGALPDRRNRRLRNVIAVIGKAKLQTIEDTEQHGGKRASGDRVIR